jgi:hypothetical protein
VKEFFQNLNSIRLDTDLFENETTSELEATVVDRLAEDSIKELAKNNVTFFYDRETNSSYRIEIVERDHVRTVVVSVVPTGLGKVASRKGLYRD